MHLSKVLATIFLLPLTMIPSTLAAASDDDTTSASTPPTTLQIEPLDNPAITCTRKSRKGDSVSVHYRGTLFSDGSQFDASYDRGAPLSFELGSGRVIQGWDQGLLDMCIGEKRKLTIPPSLGYGDRGIGPIPGGATLVFETELVGIKGVAKDEL